MLISICENYYLCYIDTYVRIYSSLNSGKKGENIVMKDQWGSVILNTQGKGGKKGVNIIIKENKPHGKYVLWSSFCPKRIYLNIFFK